MAQLSISVPVSISVPDSLKQWIEKQADGGDYSTPSEFVRSVLREKKAQEETLLQELEQLLVDGFASGDAIDDTPDARKALRTSLREKLEARGVVPSQ